MRDVSTRTPFALLADTVETVQAPKRELVAVSRRLEAQALACRPPAVAAALQDARFLTDRTRAVYARLAEAGTPSRLHARGLQAWLAPGVTGVALDDDDPLVDEWVVVVPGDVPVVFAGADLRAGGLEDEDRAFRYAVSRDPGVVAACAAILGL